MNAYRKRKTAPKDFAFKSFENSSREMCAEELLKRVIRFKTMQYIKMNILKKNFKNYFKTLKKAILCFIGRMA